MTTKRLYFDDAYSTKFNARIVQRRDNDQTVALDQSAFYPEGGGQPADHGTLNGVAVRDVQVDNDVVWHSLVAPIDGDEVQGVVDWTRRFDHMQQHHGQHLLSAAFEQLYSIATTSFHLGATTTTIDIATPALSAEQAIAVEELVNQIITEDRPVQARFVTPQELSTIPLRKPPKVNTNIRIVSVPDFDYSACGGTHPRTTGGVGLLHIRRWERRGGETRVEFVCGGRALRDYRATDALAQRLAAAFNGSVDDIEAAVERLRTQEDRSRRQLADANKQLLEYEAHELITQADPASILRVVRKSFDNRPVDDLRGLAKSITAGGCVALLGTRGEKTQLIFARPDLASVDCGALLRTTLAKYGGRGGGQAQLAQGGLPDPKQLDAALDNALETLLTSI